MKNLAHLPIEILEGGPSRLSMHWQPPKFRFVEKAYDHYYRDNVAWLSLYKHMEKIIHGSVGQKWDDVFSKIVKLCVGCRFDIKVKDRVANMIHFPFWSYRNQRWEVFPNRWGGTSQALEDVIWVRQIGHHSYSQESFYYVCPVSGIIRKVTPKRIKIEKSPAFYRRHYAFVTERKRTKKQRRKDNHEHLLKMINNPEVFEFYVDIVRKYKSELKERHRLVQRYANAIGAVKKG